jgi:AraC family transcriptional regulator of adaptative response/methylated-DNA-[protein]-cysteine methyltransferase
VGTSCIKGVYHGDTGSNVGEIAHACLSARHAAPKTNLDLPLDVRGTAFLQKVWLALRKIPAGSTVSCTEIAERIGAPKAVRAVAQACVSNHIAIAIPRHWVLPHDGNLSGCRWGVECKSALLAREAVAA